MLRPAGQPTMRSSTQSCAQRWITTRVITIHPELVVGMVVECASIPYTVLLALVL
jgi:hypothetical protein